MKKTLSIVSLFLLSLTTVSAQVCDLPSAFEGNTGANMTVMLTPGFVSSLNVSASDAYLVALSADGSVVGSEVVAGITQTALSVWGDDSSTDETDGALAGEAISFQLVDGGVLSDVTMPTPVSFTTNNMVPQLSAASLSLICEPAPSCSPSAFEGNTGANMTVMLTPGFISSLNVSASDAYLVALSADGSVVGSEVVAGISQSALSVWGDDSSTDETDGALAGEAISFQLVDGELLFDVTMPTPVTYSTNNMVPQLAAAVLTEASCGGDDGDVPGCTDATADNYNVDATDDNGLCEYSPIQYFMSTKWNMVGYTDDEPIAISDYLASNGILNSFDIIKDVTGNFWTPEVQLLSDFTPGQGYLMYNNTGDVFMIEFSEVFNQNISYSMTLKWNMVGYTDDEPIAISDYLSSNGILNSFDIIKDVTGNFWTPEVQLLSDFTPGQGYLMYNNTGDVFDISFIR